MLYKKVATAAVTTSVIGAGLGLVLATLFPSPYTSKGYQNLKPIYITVGAVGGLLIGASQEALRQLQAEQEAQEQEQDRES